MVRATAGSIAGETLAGCAVATRCAGKAVRRDGAIGSAGSVAVVTESTAEKPKENNPYAPSNDFVECFEHGVHSDNTAFPQRSHVTHALNKGLVMRHGKWRCACRETFQFVTVNQIVAGIPRSNTVRIPHRYRGQESSQGYSSAKL